MGMQENTLQNPGKELEVQRVISEGTLIAVHSRLKMSAMGPMVAVVHICRFEAGKLAELWDIGQAQPAQMENDFGMF